MNSKKDAMLSLKILIACIVVTPGALLYTFGGDKTKNTVTATYITVGLLVLVIGGLCWLAWKRRKNLD